MSTIKVDTITDGAGTGAPDFPNGATGVGGPTPDLYVYDVQKFTSSGTWTKPAGATAGDIVIVWGVGGGGSGGFRSFDTAGGGGGGAGFLWTIDDIADLSATEAVTIGAGAAAKSWNGGSSVGDTGGNTIFGTSGSIGYCSFGGGAGGTISTSNSGPSECIAYNAATSANATLVWTQGIGRGDAGSNAPNASSIYGGGGGGSAHTAENSGGISGVGGHGGVGVSTSGVAGKAGSFPGGGGAGANGANSGAGAAGYLTVTSYRGA